MKVIVHLVTGEILEGECSMFGGRDYQKGVDTRLRDFGFWLENWRYSRDANLASHKGRVFIPWSSAKYLVETE